MPKLTKAAKFRAVYNIINHIQSNDEQSSYKIN